MGIEDHLGEWVRVQFDDRGSGQVGLLMEVHPAGVTLQVNSDELAKLGQFSRLHFYPWHSIEFIELEGTWMVPGKGLVGGKGGTAG